MRRQLGFEVLTYASISSKNILLKRRQSKDIFRQTKSQKFITNKSTLKCSKGNVLGRAKITPEGNTEAQEGMQSNGRGTQG